MTEVSLGRAGIVQGLKVSRTARNSMDWHRLLEICALADTLILDEDVKQNFTCCALVCRVVSATGPNKGDVVWAGLEHGRALRILHNPRYAGAFVYGRTHTRTSLCHAKNGKY